MIARILVVVCLMALVTVASAVRLSGQITQQQEDSDKHDNSKRTLNTDRGRILPKRPHSF